MVKLADPPAHQCLRGGNGIRVRLRTVLPQGIAGSNPAGGIGGRANAAFRALWAKARRGSSPLRGIELRAEIAQSAERIHGKDEVPGSIPGLGLESRIMIFLHTYGTGQSHSVPVHQLQALQLLVAEESQEERGETHSEKILQMVPKTLIA